MKTSTTSRFSQFLSDNSAKSEINCRGLPFLWHVLSLPSNNMRENSGKVFSGISATPCGFKDCDCNHFSSLFILFCKLINLCILMKASISSLRARLHETEVNSNWLEISLRDKISLLCEITSLSTFTWLRLEWNSLRCKFDFGQIDRSEISNCSEFSI